MLPPIGRTHVVITSSDSNEDTGVLGTSNSIVVGLAEATTERQVHSSLSEDTTLLSILNTVVDTSNDSTGATRAIGAENFNGNNVGVLSNTISSTSEGRCSVGSVAVTISVVTISSVSTPTGTSTEVLVVDINTGINTVDGDTTAGGVVEDVVTATGLSVRDTSETPAGSTTLSDEARDSHDLVLLNVIDLFPLFKILF